MIDEPTRRSVLKTLTALGLFAAQAGAARDAVAKTEKLSLEPAGEFSFEALTERARELANSAYSPPAPPSPEITKKIDYEAHGKIQFPSENALFRTGDAVYPATFFHLGTYFQIPVEIYALRNGQASRLVYRPDYFDMPDDSIARELPDDAGFAGFRLHEAKSEENWKTHDWIAFLGASYFRAIGDEGQYGLSARGVAIDTAIDSPEEFPRFTEFYIEPATSPSKPVSVYALLNGPSLAGAYHFELHRTEGVEVDVDARLFFRNAVHRLGIAPLTSMYWYSEYNTSDADDWRPEVHDSDGLALWTGRGERIWRPLNNPPHTIVSSFMDYNPRGFGLMQRDRRFDHYLDGVRYDRRPSLWVAPHSDWGKGAVQLVEIPTNDEIHDNIVAFWVPEGPVEAGNEYRFGYRLLWYGEEPYVPDRLARCTATRMGRGGEPGTDRPEGVRKFIVEFAGSPLSYLTADDPVKVSVEASRGELSYIFCEPVPGTNRWRAQFDLTPDGETPIELRAYLHVAGDPVTETWLYQYHPPRN